MGMGIMWRICTVSEKQCPLYAKPLGEMIAERFGVHGFEYEMKTGLCVAHCSNSVRLETRWAKQHLY